MVVEALIYELAVVLRKVVSRVKALLVLSNPEPRSEEKVLPPMVKLVVEAVVNVPYVVEEKSKI